MDWESINNKMNEFYSQRYQVHQQMAEFWRSNIFLSWRWWLMAIMTVLPWPLWFLLRRRESADRLMYAGLFIALVATILDGFGIAMRFWSYSAPLVPLVPSAFPFNVSVLPVVTMLFIQYFPRIKPVWKALVYSAAGAFLFEQIMEWLGLYYDIIWKHVYSFPILFVMYLFADWMTKRRRFELLP